MFSEAVVTLTTRSSNRMGNILLGIDSFTFTCVTTIDVCEEYYENTEDRESRTAIIIHDDKRCRGMNGDSTNPRDNPSENDCIKTSAIRNVSRDLSTVPSIED